MIPAEKPDNEEARLQKLRDYGILDTETEAAFDRITRIVAKTLGVPISLVSLVDEDRQWFKSHHGIDATETPRDLAFCAHAIHGEDVFVVSDPERDERFRDNPLVTEGPEIRFYAGAPLITSDGYKLGTLCAIDDMRHFISEEHKLLLQDLASLVIDEIELRKLNRSLERTISEHREKSENQNRESVRDINVGDLSTVRDSMHDQGVLFHFSGYMTEQILTGLAAAVRQKLQAEGVDRKTMKGVFAIFVELVQNIIRYSTEKHETTVGESSIDLRYGVITVGKSETSHYVACGNMINNADVQRLSLGLDQIVALDKDGLKALHKRTLRGPVPETSKGGLSRVHRHRKTRIGRTELRHEAD